jgi:hypothetical protein
MVSPDQSHERCKFSRSQPLLTDEDDRRPSRSRQREDLGEVSIQRDHHS